MRAKLRGDIVLDSVVELVNISIGFQLVPCIVLADAARCQHHAHQEKSGKKPVCDHFEGSTIPRTFGFLFSVTVAATEGTSDSELTWNTLWVDRGPGTSRAEE